MIKYIYTINGRSILKILTKCSTQVTLLILWYCLTLQLAHLRVHTYNDCFKLIKWNVSSSWHSWHHHHFASRLTGLSPVTGGRCDQAARQHTGDTGLGPPIVSSFYFPSRHLLSRPPETQPRASFFWKQPLMLTWPRRQCCQHLTQVRKPCLKSEQLRQCKRQNILGHYDNHWWWLWL